MTLLFCIIVGLVTFIAFLYAFLRKEIEVSRTVVINAPKSEVFEYVRKLNNQPKWMPWMAENGKTNIKFIGEDGKIGAISHWKTNTFLGKGFQKITKIRAGKVVETQLHLFRSPKSRICCFMGMKQITPEKTKMVCGIKGLLDFPALVFLTFSGRNRDLDHEIEKGLIKLKNILESEKFVSNQSI